MKETCVGNA